MLEKYRLKLLINDVEVDIKTLSRSMTDFSQSWQVTLRNTGITVGYWANEDVKIQYQKNEDDDWRNIFTGKVSSSGAIRSRGYITDDLLSLELIDLAKAKLTKIVPNNQTLANFYISNINEESTSLIHYLASLAGITSVNADEILDVLTIVTLGENTIWSELQKIAETYCLNLYFDNNGTLCLKSAYIDSETESEYILGDNSEFPIIGKLNEDFATVEGNSYTCTFDIYEKQDEQIVFKSYENYVETTDVINIDILPGCTWPEEGVTNLTYKSTTTDIEFPLVTDIKTPSIGPNDYYDISYSGGKLELESFNGSTDETELNPGYAQIILKNTGAVTCSINKFTITGTPYILKSENKVTKEVQDLSEVDKISQTIDEKYAASVSSVEDALQKYLEINQSRTRVFSFSTYFMPFLERNDVVTLKIDDENIKCKVLDFENAQKNTRVNSLKTTINLKEINEFHPTTFSRTSVTPNNPISIVGSKGDPGESVIVEYLKTSSLETPTATDTIFMFGDYPMYFKDRPMGLAYWSTTPPNADELLDNEYIWQRTYSNGKWSNPIRLSGNPGVSGSPGKDGDFGVLTLSFSGSVLNLQGNGQDEGYIIYNNSKFYFNSNYTCSVGGDGIIIADISQSPAVIRYNKISVVDDVLSFVDFNTGNNGITKEDADSQWQYIMVGEFSSLNTGNIINATLKPPVSAKTFLSDEFTSILRKGILEGADIEAWSKAMGCDEYYNTLAVSTLFAGKIFANEITLTDKGVIKSSDADESVRIEASGLAKFKNLILEFSGNTMFKVDSTTGNVNFGYDSDGNPLFYYEQSTKTIKNNTGSMVISPDGTITIDNLVANNSEITNGSFTGHMEASTGIFQGSIDSPSFSSLPSTGDSSSYIDLPSNETYQIKNLETFCDTLGIEKLKYYECTNSIDSSVKYMMWYKYKYFKFYDANLSLDTEMEYVSGAASPYRSPYDGSSFRLTIYYGGGDVFTFKDIPTSSTGLATGQVWNDNGTLKIIT